MASGFEFTQPFTPLSSRGALGRLEKPSQGDVAISSGEDSLVARKRLPPYIELQVCSNFSFLRGASHPEELIEQAAKLGYSSIALTDRHSLAGIVRAHVAAKQAGISLLVGSSVPLYHTIPQIKSIPKDSDETSEAQPNILQEFLLPLHLLLYPSSKSAYGRLCRLLSQGKLCAPKGHCFLTLEDIFQYQQGLLAIAVVHNLKDPQLIHYLEKLRSIFDCGRFSIAISFTYGPDNQQRVMHLRQLSRITNVPLVATNDVHYHIPERRMLQDVLTCIRLGRTIKEAGLLLFQNAERFLKSPQEMARLFAEFPQAVKRSSEIAETVQHFSLDQLDYQYPNEICPNDKTPIQHLSELTWRCARERYPQGIPDKVVSQIKHELALIAELKYEKYFLTVYDIVLFAKSQNILCQGRGAAANSAVCYVLGITAADPDRINLLFERFISKERNEPPDIDIDFEHERREEVLQYVYTKYGRHRAALTAALITYRTRSAVRDAGKVFGLPLETIERIIKLLTRTEESTINTLDLEKRGLNPEDTDVLRTIDLARQLLGFPRHLSQHVGGFIISERPLNEIVPIENAAMPERTVIEWDKDDIESMGMLKIDLLGLGMLTAIRKAFALVNKRSPMQPPLMLYNIPAEDPQVYQMVCRADTIGVFQIESRAQMSMLPRLKPRCYYDLVIEVAIIRPGPIQGGMVHPFLQRRSGKETVSYPSPQVEKILAPTLGVPIFQEQVMELAVVAAGFTPGEADQLRRAMASWKKKANLISGFREHLLKGMRSNGYSREFAEQIFQQINGFGEYGFPQSHAASFALLVYISAWLKRYHPAAFAAALINSQPMGFYQVAQIVEDVKKHGVQVHGVDVNSSDIDCTLEESAQGNHSYKQALRLGMRLVKGLREDEAKRIVSAVGRNGKYSSLLKLFRESGASTITLKKLARADAFLSLGLNRQEALWEISKFRDEALPMFDRCALAESPAKLPSTTAEWQVTKDYEMLGLSLKGHPLSFLRTKLAARGVVTAGELKENLLLANGSIAAVSGMVLVRQRPATASGIVFMTLEDETGMANLIIKPQVFKKYRDVICDSTIILAQGRIQRVDDITHLLAEEFVDLTHSFERLTMNSRDFH
jgi:error-prone DNA polymerase